jgi:hypothetical protein
MKNVQRTFRQFAIRNPQSAFTDSPWFYVLAFSLMALLAIVVIGPKYGRRQSAMDRKYQARERIEEQRAAGNNPDGKKRNVELADHRPFATPGDTLVPLWPLAVVLVAIALFAFVMLIRGPRRPGSLAEETALL